MTQAQAVREERSSDEPVHVEFQTRFPLRGALHDARAVAGLLAASFTMLIVCALPARAIEIQEVVSPKGIHAWLVEDNSVPLVSMRFSFKGGASQDPSGKEGLPI